ACGRDGASIIFDGHGGVSSIKCPGKSKQDPNIIGGSSQLVIKPSPAKNAPSETISARPVMEVLSGNCQTALTDPDVLQGLPKDGLAACTDESGSYTLDHGVISKK